MNQFYVFKINKTLFAKMTSVSVKGGFPFDEVLYVMFEQSTLSILTT